MSRQFLRSKRPLSGRPVVIFFDAIDTYYPNPTQEGVTTIETRNGRLHDIVEPFENVFALIGSTTTASVRATHD